MYRLSRQSIFRHAALAAAAATVVCLSGCSGVSGTALSGGSGSPSGSSSSMTLVGSVHGGQQPVQGAHVFVFAAGNTGYGSASTSLLTSGTLDTTPGGLTNDDFYTTTDAGGNFTYGSVTCPTPATEVYLLATGGNQPGSPVGTSNNAIALTAALGRCDGINASTFTNMNEVTTVAMATALNQFMVDGAHVGAPSTNTVGLVNAFTSINNLVDPSTGVALAVTPQANGVAPQATLNTLADIIAACLNSSTNSSTACLSLFAATTPTSSTVPTNVLGAALNIAAFPGANVASLYALVGANAAPFQPTLSVQPNDFSLGITYTPPIPASQSGTIAVDGSGNTWIVSCQSCLTPSPANPIDIVLKYEPNGSFAGAYGAGILHFLRGIAVDTAGNVWTINQTTSAHPQDEIIEITSNGVANAPITNSDFGNYSLQGIAFDKLGTMWITMVNGAFNFGGGLTQVGGQVVAMTTSGTILQAFNEGNIGGSALSGSGPSAVAVDNSNNIWVLGTGNNSLLKFTDTAGAPNVPSYITKYNPGGFSVPLGIAINAGNELWITQNNSTVSHIYGFSGSNAAGSPLSDIGVFSAPSILTDGVGQVIIPNCRVGCPGSGSSSSDNLLRLGYTGSPDTGGAGANYGIQVAGFSAPAAAAADASGAVWVSNNVNGTVTQVIGFAAPTVVPLSSAVATGKVGVKP